MWDVPRLRLFRDFIAPKVHASSARAYQDAHPDAKNTASVVDDSAAANPFIYRSDFPKTVGALVLVAA